MAILQQLPVGSSFSSAVSLFVTVLTTRNEHSDTGSCLGSCWLKRKKLLLFYLNTTTTRTTTRVRMLIYCSKNHDNRTALENELPTGSCWRIAVSGALLLSQTPLRKELDAYLEPRSWILSQQRKTNVLHCCGQASTIFYVHEISISETVLQFRIVSGYSVRCSRVVLHISE